MKVKQIRDSIEDMKANLHDPEHVHSEKDWLYLEVLKAIARGSVNSKVLATEAIKAEEVKASWTACA